MRRFSTVSAVVAGALAMLLGVYVTQAIHKTPSGQAIAKEAGFSPNSLAVDASLKLESWDAF